MIKTLLTLILLFIISKDNLNIFQLQYYSNERLLKVKLHNHNYNYLFFIPFFLLDLLINDNNFIIISLIFVILISLDTKKKISKLKYTKRAIRLLFFTLFLTLLLSLFIQKFYLLFIFLMIIFNPLLLIISNYLDSINRLIISFISIHKLKNKLKNIKPIIIGITGSYGKTSTKNYLESILKTKYRVLKTSGNINTFKGVISFLNKYLTNDINILIIEIGLDKKRGIDKFLKLFKFDYSFLTGIEKCHLATFKNIENIINEKMKLIKNSKVGFINNDNRYYHNNNYNSYSLNDLEYLKVENGMTYFKIKGLDKEFKTYIIGDHQILNIVGVIKFLIYLKVDINTIYQGVIKLQSEPHRYELKKIDDMLIIDDAYNSNETSFKCSIDNLKYFKMKKILITPGVIELGKENYEVNYKLGVYIKDKIDEIILIGNNSLSIKRALDDYKYTNYLYFNSFKEGFNYLKSKKEKDFIVLIENDLLDYYLT